MLHKVICTALASLALVFPAAALAAFITVNTLDNESNGDGDCSLREAIRSANENTSFDACAAGDVGADTVFIGIGGTINVGSALAVTEPLVLLGSGRDALTISGQNSSGVFLINLGSDAEDFEMNGLTVADGSESLPGAGVWIQQGGTFTFENVRFRNNHTSASGGGAIAVEIDRDTGGTSSLVIRRSIFEDNSAASGDGLGGAIHSASSSELLPLDSVSIQESSFFDNHSERGGGAIALRGVRAVLIDQSVFKRNAADGSLNGATSGGAVYFAGVDIGQIKRSTFLDNFARNGGGGLALFGALATLENVTFNGNSTSTGFATAISARTSSTAAIFYSTLIGNDQPMRDDRVIVSKEGSDVSLSHSIVWSPLAASDEECERSGGSINSQGFNIDASGTCATEPTDLPMTDPMLSQFGDYGDDTTWVTLETFIPLTGSPALDGGATNCAAAFGLLLTSDQRGEARPVDGDASGGAECDIGAAEFQPAGDPDSYVLTASVLGDGTIISAPDGIECPLDCEQPYLAGTSVSLSVIPQPGFRFLSWTGDCSGSGSCTVTMNGARNVGATFEPAVTTFPVEVQIDGNGIGMVTSTPAGIGCPGDCSESFDDGETVTLDAIAGASSEFLGWSADCASSGTGACQLTIDQAYRAIAIFGDGDLLFLDGFE